MNVASEAKRLAIKYGADPAKAYTAGILHDVMKAAGKEAQFAAIKAAGIDLTPVERLEPKLWHAIAGVAFIKDVLGVGDEEIVSAVRFHTTARGGMTVLDKCLYIADFISADRTYDGVEEMRALAEISLEKVMLTGIQYCVEEIITTGRLMHTDMIDAYNEILLNKKINLKGGI